MPNRWQWNATLAQWELEAGLLSLTIRERCFHWQVFATPGNFCGTFDTLQEAKEEAEDWAANQGLKILLALPLQSGR